MDRAKLGTHMMPPIIHRSMFYSLYRFSISQTRQNHSNMT